MNMLTQARMSREQLVSELGIAGLGADMQGEIVSAVGENIVKAVTLAVILKLPPDAQAEFKRLMDTDDGEAVLKLLKTHIPDPDAFVEEEARKELGAFKETLAKKLAQ
ncbi:MAG: hypothetical protein Q7S26_00020 [bacterium]|nr:hypothetical protein [bacterium]